MEQAYDNIIEIQNISKVYAGGFVALDDVSLNIRRGEIFALLGPNGAGKTTLINTIAGAVKLDTGTITVCGHDIITDWRAARACIGLVPQEMPLEIFTPVAQALRYQRGFYGKRADEALIERVLRDLSLWDKRNNEIRTLSGGMKRRVLIGMALMNEPRVLFLDEPTAGVDVDLRRDMWRIVRRLQKTGTTIILTTHYLEEAEEMADSIGVINGGKIIIVDEKDALMARLGQKTLTIFTATAQTRLPRRLADYGVMIDPHDAHRLHYTYKTSDPDALTVGAILDAVADADITVRDIETTQSSLEDIFVDLVKK